MVSPVKGPQRVKTAGLKRRRLSIFILLGILVLLCFFVLYRFTDIIVRPQAGLSSAPHNPPEADWPMFRHDLNRTGSLDTGSAYTRGDLKGVFSTGGPVCSSPAVVGGIVYFGSQDYYLYALDAATGDKLWAFKTGSFVDSSPTVSGGVVYFGSNDGFLY